MATQKKFIAKNGLDNNSTTIINVADPVNNQDAATKAYCTNAGNLISGTVPTARLGSGTADSTTYLRGDNTWATVSGGGATLSTAVAETTLYLGLSASSSGAWTSALVDTALFFNAATHTLNSTNFNSTSDIRLKSSISTIANALDTVVSLRGVGFNWNSTSDKSYGLIAQELELVIPDLVTKNNFEGSLEDQRSVNYNGLIGFLIEAIKELKAEVDQLKGA